MKRKTKSGPVFTFNHITKRIASKASQEDYTPTKVIKENSDIFSNFLNQTLRENCPNTELFLVHIFLYSD